MMRSLFAPLIVLAMSLPVAAVAQDREQTLADIRQELSVLLFEIQDLRRELSTTEGGMESVGGGSVLDRVNAMEEELRRLTSRTEELENRVARIVSDATNRIGDLEFRLVELEGGDLGALTPTPPLGGEAPASVPVPVAPAPSAPQDGGAALAMSEQADFDRAQAAFEAGNYAEAAELFATFNETYYGGPLAMDAYLMHGQARERLGETERAARAYLDAFNAAPEGPHAAEALLRLGRALGALGQRDEACLMLEEVRFRFPDSPMVAEAQQAVSELSCQ